ncbi:MAG: ABC transporter permease [Gemmataceae bacterium]|nr:ABC transporter permease [Gemmataceae bacterium]
MSPSAVTLSPGAPVTGSAWRAWCYLIWLCLQRQARARQMVWIALALLVFSAALVALNTAAGRWGMHQWRWFAGNRPVAGEEAAKAAPKASTKPGSGPVPSARVILTFEQVMRGLELQAHSGPWPSPALTLHMGIVSSWRATLDRSDFYRFSTWVVFAIFLSFLLPIWSLSFATEALGGEREARSLLWLLTRPLSRPAIYLGKFVALLPWSLGLNLGGFGLLCLLAGQPGYLAFRLYWPAVLWATLAFVALFHLMGACFRRAAVVALVYSFFLETLLGNMPGLMKRISISFYARCMMFDVAGQYGVQPEKPSVYLPVSGPMAWCVLMGLTGILLVVGMVVFARSEYQDLS